MGFPLDVAFCFSLADFLIFFLCIYSLLAWLVCVSMYFSLSLSCMGLSALIGFNGLFPFSCWERFLLQKFFQTLSFFLLPLRPLYSNIGAFNIVPEVSEAILNSFHSFPFILLFSSYFHHSIFQLTLYVLLSHSTVGSF